MAYCNLPITPNHNKYLCVFWKGGIYVQHVAIEGLAMVGGIQENIADVTIALLKFHEVGPNIKWVDYFILF